MARTGSDVARLTRAMTVSDRMERLVRAAARRPLVTLAIVLALALAGAALSLGLSPSTDPGTFVSRSSSSYQVTQDDHAHFGGDPVIVLIREPLEDLVLTKELATLTKLEACLAGQTVGASEWYGRVVDGTTNMTPTRWVQRHSSKDLTSLTASLR